MDINIDHHFRYTLTGLLNKIQGLFVLIGLIEGAHLNEHVAFSISFVYVVVFNFFMNERFVFKKKGAFILFCLITTGSYFLNILIFHIVNMSQPYIVASISASLLSYPFHFLLNKHITYAPRLLQKEQE